MTLGPGRPSVRNKTPATKVENVESEPRSGANIGDYSGRLRLLSGASNKANFTRPCENVCREPAEGTHDIVAWARASMDSGPRATPALSEIEGMPVLRERGRVSPNAMNRVWEPTLALLSGA
jgi:hypothetical protein